MRKEGNSRTKSKTSLTQTKIGVAIYFILFLFLSFIACFIEGYLHNYLIYKGNFIIKKDFLFNLSNPERDNLYIDIKVGRIKGAMPSYYVLLKNTPKGIFI